MVPPALHRAGVTLVSPRPCAGYSCAASLGEAIQGVASGDIITLLPGKLPSARRSGSHATPMCALYVLAC